MNKAKLFWIGHSQAVRLPKEFRFEGTEVQIRRHGVGVILEPLPGDWTWLDELYGRLDADFEQSVAGQPDITTRPEVDRFFPE